MERLRGALAAEDTVEWAYLVGSATRGGSYRDVDVAVMPRPGAWTSLFDAPALADRIQAALGLPVDVIPLDAAPVTFTGPALPERIVVLDRAPARRREWELDVKLRWLDFEPTWNEFQSLRNEALRRRLAR